MKKNTAAFVLALLGAICGLIGGILWTACADACASVEASAGTYLVGFIILGMGGAVIALIGGIQAFGFKKGGSMLTLLGLIMQIGQLILACVFCGGFSFVMNVWTIIAILLLAIATNFAFKKQN